MLVRFTSQLHCVLGLACRSDNDKHYHQLRFEIMFRNGRGTMSSDRVGLWPF